jgi:hypothetical protein
MFADFRVHGLNEKGGPDFLYAAPDITAYAAFSKESRMKFANATKLHRKSGEAPHFVFPIIRCRPVVKALEKGRVQPMYAKVREHGAPVQGARIGGKLESVGLKDSQPKTELKSLISLLTCHRKSAPQDDKSVWGEGNRRSS